MDDFIKNKKAMVKYDNYKHNNNFIFLKYFGYI